MGTLLVYALIQVLHNFGALLIVGLSSHGLWSARRHHPSLWLAGWIALAWMVQGVTGASFGWVTYHADHHLPDIHGIAVVALMIKVACVVGGVFLMVSCARFGRQWTTARQLMVWTGSLGLGVLALCAAAFLRWFS
ncbi:MAG: hypothetical protein G3H99_01295 [Ferrovum sp.]|nr:hypothetical protein [Ferrovum sp.]NDU86560.1 hypothetical protein [Ferrovum sp.]